MFEPIRRSDVVLLVVDARFPSLHFSPSLYDYVTREMKKPFVLIMNKCDLVPDGQPDQWVSLFAAL